MKMVQQKGKIPIQINKMTNHNLKVWNLLNKVKIVYGKTKITDQTLSL